MRKTWLVFAAIAMVVCSCSTNDEVSEIPGGSLKAISFDAYTSRTRAAATDVTTSNLSTFVVSAFGNSAIYFDSVSFTKGSTNWASAQTWYWPSFNLEFAAWNVPSTTTSKTAAEAKTNFVFKKGTKDSDTTLTVRIPANLKNQEDLVAAYKTGSAAPTTAGDPVSLQFNHYLTQVTVNASNFNNNYTVKVKGVKIANLADSGKYYFKRGKMIAAADEVNKAASSDFVYDLSTAVTLNAPTDAKAYPDSTNLLGSGKWYLIPQTVTAWDQSGDKTNTKYGTYLGLKVCITTSTGAKVYPATYATKSGDYTNDGFAWIAIPVPSQLAFAQGKKYNVTVHFFKSGGAGYQDPEQSVPSSPGPGNLPVDNTKPIVFSATVSAWGDAVGVTVDL